MRSADQNALRLDPATLLNLRARFRHEVSRNEQQIDPYKCHALFAIIEYSRAYFARVMKALVISLAVVSRFFHANIWRNIPLGETRFENRRWRCHLVGCDAIW